MDAEAPAVPRLRESLVAARAAALERARAEQAEAERRAALAAAEAASRPAAASPAPAPPQPLPSPAPASPPPERTAATPAPARPDPPPAPVPAPPAPSAPVAAAPASRALLSRVQPRFPEAALRRRLEGEVEVLLTVAPDGGVEAVEVLRAEPPGVFEREAVLAARRWRYAPAEARSTVRVVLSFRRPD
jgi:protein TonB